MSELRINKEDRYFLDCLREFLGYNPLYEDMSKEERHELQNKKRKLNAKPYALFTEEEKEKKRDYVRAWRKRQKEKSTQLNPLTVNS